MQREEDLTRYGTMTFHRDLQTERVAEQVKELEVKQQLINERDAQLEAIADVKRTALEKMTMTNIGAGFFEKRDAKGPQASNFQATKGSQGFNSPRNITTGNSNTQR